MKHLVAILALVSTLALTAAPMPADEPPHLSFLQKLRDRQEPDIALKYLATYARLFETLDQALKAPANWSQENRQNLLELLNLLEKERKALDHSKLFQ